MRRFGVWLALAAGWGSLEGLVSIGQCADPPATDRQIAEWVRQLGDPAFAVREAATRELKKQFPEATAAVRRAAGSADPEVARRAAVILKEFARRSAEADLRRMRAAVKNWEPDLFVERAIRYTGDEDHVWQGITDLGWAAWDHAAKTYGGRLEVYVGTLRSPPRDFSWQAMPHGARILPAERTTVGTTRADEEAFLFRGGKLDIGRYGGPILVAAGGPVSVDDGAGGRFLFANDIVTLTGDAACRVIVCDGPFVVKPVARGPSSGIGLSVVVANGDVRFSPSSSVSACLVLATGDVYLPEKCSVTGSTVLAGGTIHLSPKCRVKYSTLKERVPEPTAPFKFFELSRVGLEIKATDGGVRIEKVEEKKPFAALRKGDVVTVVDGKKVESVAGFRKQVRSAFVQGDCTLTIRRGTETKEIAVRFPR